MIVFKRSGYNQVTSSQRREEVIKLAAQIASLREELHQAESELDGILGGNMPIASPAPNSLAAQAFAERDAERSLNQQIIEALAEIPPGAGADAESLMRRLPSGTNITSVRSALARLADQGKIERTARGKYAISHVSEPLAS